MRKLIFGTLMLGCMFLSAQQIQVFSAKDSLRVSFASLLINGDLINYSKTASDEGIIQISSVIEDSVNYTVTVHCFGFDKFSKKYYGYQIKKIEKIYLVPSNISLEEVVVTAQYEPTSAEKAVQKIKVIDKEKIQQMGAINLRDVLTNQMNVRLQQDNVLGSTMSLQGINGQNVKILVDGVPVIGRLDGNIDISQINMNNVERIEFIEGPLSVQYGTDALAGTINIITKKTLTKKLSAGLTSYYESIGTYNLTADLAYSHKKHGLQLSAGRNYFDGWNSSEPAFFMPKPHIADSTRFKQWKPKEQYFASLAYTYSFKKFNFGFKSAYFDEVIINRGLPLGVYKEYALDDRYFTKRVDNSLSLTGSLSKNWSVNALSAYNYYQRIKRTVYKDLTTLGEEVTTGSGDQDTNKYTLLMNRASFIHNSPSSKISYELGYDINNESILGRRIEGQTKNIGDYALFATSEYKLSKLVIKPGIRYAYNTAYKTPLVPSLNVKWNLSDHHVFRASYARGFRAPSLKELYFEFNDINHNINGNSNLRAEQSDNYSVSYNYNRDIRKCRVKFDVSAFYNNIFNRISLQQVGTSTEYKYLNVDRYRSLGIQLGSSLNFKRLFLQGGFNYTGRLNELAGINNVPDFSYSPEVQFNGTYKWLKPKLTFSLFYKYNGSLPVYIATTEGTVNGLSQDYQIMDATLSKFFWKERINLAIGCKNLFNVQTIRSTGVGGAHSAASSTAAISTGRNYFVKLALNFSRS
ncbi:hypothetical protein CNR22_00225 [Sphingobacteriaceae bacterium]|nr:hypothetical protein CNR22_00225 [Sphingobacteriaceae bacterium]